MKQLIIILFGIFSSFQWLNAQQEVERTIIVEHFTNTYCSICASRNPGFYNNLSNFPTVLHVAYHPSAPYSACPLSQHNVVENDSRTNYYNVYGGTPRLVLQGDVIAAGANYASSNLFTPYQNETSAFSIASSIELNASMDSVVQLITITKEANSTLTSLHLFSVLVESELQFAAQNGETVHHDVFRKSFVGSDPVSIVLPSAVGNQITKRLAVKTNQVWELSEMKAVAVLQDNNGIVEQAGASEKLSEAGTADINNLEGLSSFTVYPTVVSQLSDVTISINQEQLNNNYSVRLVSLTGQVLQHFEILGNHQKLPAANTATASGIYLLELVDPSAQVIESKKLIIQ